MRRTMACAVLAVLVLGMLLGLPACGRQAGQEAGQTEPQGQEPSGQEPAPEPSPALTVIGPWSGPEMEQFMPVLDAAGEAVGADVEYRIYRAEDLSNVLPLQFQAGHAPGDVIFMWDWWIKENAQHAADLTQIWQAEASSFLPRAAEADGKVVAVPYAMSVKPGFWYRKSLFEAHGLEPPTSWDEFWSLLDTIRGIDGIRDPIVTGDGVGWPVSDVTEHFLITAGGPQMQLDLIDGTIAWTDDAVRRVFTDYLVPSLEYFSDPVEWTQAVNLWWNEEYALYFMGNWISGMVDSPGDLGVFTLPGARGVVAETDYAFVPAYSDNIDKALELVAYLISREGMMVRARQGGKLAGRTDVDPGVYPAADAALAAALAGIETTLPDLDDSVGGDWQRTFWDQLRRLWVQPDAVDEVLVVLQEARGE